MVDDIEARHLRKIFEVAVGLASGTDVPASHSEDVAARLALGWIDGTEHWERLNETQARCVEMLSGRRRGGEPRCGG